MKKILFLIILNSPFIIAEEGKNTTTLKLPLDASHLTLPPLNIFQQNRDFTELLGISTTAPASSSSMYFHADIPDSILDAGPVDAFIFYGNGQDGNWIEEDAYYLGTPGYENTFEAEAQTPTSGEFHIGVQSNLTFGGLEVIASQCPYNVNDNVPASWYINVCDDEEGDEETGGQSLDILDVNVAVSDERFHVHLKNAGGGFPTGDFFGPWYLYVVGFLNPEDPDSSLYGIAYGDGGFGLLYPGVWKFQLGEDLPTFVGDIDYSITGNNLYMAANMSDIFNDPDFGEWPNEFESVVVTGLTVAASFTDLTFGDQTDPAFLNPGFQSYQIGVNNAPQISELSVDILADSSNMSLVKIQTNYTDDDNHFPLSAGYTIYQSGSEIYSGEMISYDHLYSDGALFEIEVPLGPGSYDIHASFSDGMDVDESIATIDLGGGESEYEVSLISGWNLVGLSVQVDDPSQQSVFPTSIEETLFGFSDSYFLTDSFLSGAGYWLRFDEDNLVTVSGSNINELNVSLTEGWNIIAGPSESISISWALDPDSLIVPNTLFGYDVSGYLDTDFLVPGYGYWIRSFGDGDISLTVGQDEYISEFPFLEKEQDNMNTISVNDNILYFGNSNLSERELLSFGLPPKPPTGSRDIRFSDDTKLCTKDECAIEIMNFTFDYISIDCDIRDDHIWNIIDERGNSYECTNLYEYEPRKQTETIILRKSIYSPESLTEFTLSPAHPNPFNPVTNIQFTIPEVSDLNIVIYDVEGRLIEILADKRFSPGVHKVWWNASEVSSGVYFLHIESSKFSRIQKLMFIK